MIEQLKKLTSAAMVALLLTAPLWGSGCMKTADDSKIKREATAQNAAPRIDTKDKHMQVAVNEALDGISHREGGPFGAAIYKGDELVGQGHSRVLAEDDPTMHGVIAAIRDAGQGLQTTDLSDCVIYVTGEPCDMCLNACLSANIKRVYYGCTAKDNDRIGYPEEALSEALAGRDDLQGYLKQIDLDACQQLYATYSNTSMVHRTTSSNQ